MHVALRIPAKEPAAQGNFSPAFRGPHVVEPVLPTGTTAELVNPVSGTKLLANRTRLKFLDAPQPTTVKQLAGGGGSLPASLTPHPPVPIPALHRAARTEREDVVEIEPPHSVASQQTVQQPLPAAALPAATPSTPFRPSDLKHIKSAKKRFAKPQTQEALQHKEIIYLHRRLKAYKGARKEVWRAARKEVWKVARGVLRLPVERGWTQPPESLVAKMERQVEDSPAPFRETAKAGDDIYLAEFPEVTAAPRWGTPSRTSFLTASSRQFIARPSARVREVRGWKEIPEYEPEIRPDPNPALGGLLAPRARLDEGDSDEVVEARPALPTPATSGVSAELKGSAELSPLPAARVPGSARAAPQPAPTSPAAPPGGSIGQGPLPALCPTTTAAANAFGNLASQGWDFMAARCVWWTLAAVGFWLSSAERSAALMGPGRTSLREFLNGVYRAGQALLGTTVATAVPSRPVAAPAAPRAPSTSAPFAGPDHPSALPGTPEETTPPPPLPDLSAEEFRLPESSVAARPTTAAGHGWAAEWLRGPLPSR
ncbi:hypothetical protein Emag_007700 [Eimeria magna]